VGPKVKIMTVVKADAYGHGIKQIAALLMQSGTDIFGVANLAEARAVHGVGKGWPVLMLGACLPEEVEPAVLDGVRPTLSTWAEAREFSRAAVRLSRSEEHTSELQSPYELVCRLLLEKKKGKGHQSRSE